MLFFVIGVRFADEPLPTIETLPLPQTVASMIFYGYLSIDSVVERISPSADKSKNKTNQTGADLFSTARENLPKIFPLRFRLEILENIFSLIFLQQNELKIDDTTEIVEQSVNTASASLSPIENLLLSSMQSNFTNESFHSSTNISMKTQLSVRKFDNELDENVDDNASVCSSSMSSVGASNYHSMNRTGLLIDQQVLYQLLSFLRDQLVEIRNLHQKIKDKSIDRATVSIEASLDRSFHGYSISTSEQFTSRATKLHTIVSETLWRYQLLTANTNESTSQENKIDRQDKDDGLVDNPIIKKLILPVRKLN